MWRYYETFENRKGKKELVLKITIEKDQPLTQRNRKKAKELIVENAKKKTSETCENIKKLGNSKKFFSKAFEVEREK